MGIILYLLICVVVALVATAIYVRVPDSVIHPWFKTLILVAALIGLLLILANALGLLGGFGDVAFPRVR